MREAETDEIVRRGKDQQRDTEDPPKGQQCAVEGEIEHKSRTGYTVENTDGGEVRQGSNTTSVKRDSMTTGKTGEDAVTRAYPPETSGERGGR